MRLSFFLWILLFLLPARQLGAQPHLDARLSKSQVMTGDSLILRLTAKIPRGAAISEPQLPLPPDFSAFEILRNRPWDTLSEEGQNLLMQRDFVLIAWDSARLQIPPISLAYRLPGQDTVQLLRSRPLNLSIAFPPPEKGEELKPIRPILKEPPLWSDFLKPYMLIPLFLLLWIAVRWWRRYSQRQIPEPIHVEPPLPPDEYALQQLGLLEEKAPWKEGRIKEFHSALSHLLGQYLEERFGIRALEETSTEIIGQMAERSDISEEWQQKLKHLFQIGDLVKFAKAQPEESFHRQALEDIRQFVLLTRPTQSDTNLEEEE